VRYATKEFQHQEVFFGCRTDGRYVEKSNIWQGLGSLLVLGTVDIPAPGFRLGQKQTVDGNHRRAMPTGRQASDSNHRIDVQKVIIHPGEINCMKCWPRNKRILATHSDNKNVYLWDIKHQKNAADKANLEANYPDLL